jgi:hypothetical protein
MRLSILAVAFVTLGAAAPSKPFDPDLTTVKADMRKLVGAQESYFSDHNSYTADIAALKFTASDSVVIKISEFHPFAYAAVGTVKGKDAASCVMFIGQVASMPKTAKGKVAEAEGGVVCDD